MENKMTTLTLTPEQFELIQTAIEYWVNDQEMMVEDGMIDDQEWDEQKRILNDPNFPF
jgi:hypothetical protein